MIGNRYSPPNPKRRADRQSWEREVTPLLVRLAEQDAQVAAAAIAVIRKSLPSYDEVPDEALQASAWRNSRNASKVLTARRLPSEEELSKAAVAAGERARQGVPVNEALTAYRIAMHEIREFLTEAAGRSGCSPAVILEMTQLLWALADAVSIRMATAHQEAILEIARHDEHQRAEFLRGLVFGSLGTAEIRRLGPAYDLALDTHHVAVRGRPAAGTTTSELIRALSEPARTSGGHAFFGVIDSEVFGVAPVMPDTITGPGTVGIGPPTDLAAIESSFASASRVVKVAERFGLVGVFRLGDVCLRAAVAAEDELGELLVERYIRPLDVLGGRVEAFVQTVAVYLDESLNFKSTAQRLDVHQNTVRHRVGRFEQLTGARLDHPYTAFEVWWALQRSLINEQISVAAPQV